MAVFKSQNFDPAALGSLGEQAACDVYRRNGYRIIARNLINSRGKRIGELDFIACNRQALVFVEVKTRARLQDRFGDARYAVNYRKQRKLLKMAKLFLFSNPHYRHLQPRIDICLVAVKSLDKSRFCVTIIPHAVSDNCG